MLRDRLFDRCSWAIGVALLAAGVTVIAPRSAQATSSPLVVSPTNPRYFSVDSGGAERPVYLTGSNLWNNMQDGPGSGTCDQPGRPFDFTAYLDFLAAHHMNFVRGWRWEHFKFKIPDALDVGGPYCVAPHPWARTGGGVAYDGGPRFDLSTFDQAYFDRLRHRVIEADNRGIYMSVMLFEGFCLHLCDADTQIAGHPFDGQNNVNGIDINAFTDYTSVAVSPAVKELQRAYIRKVINTVQDLDNVLYEVANESLGSVAWQYDIINYIKQYEDTAGHQKHPVGMSSEFPGGNNQDLWNSPADWIMPGTWPPVPDDYGENPPPATGAKVVISDNDHYQPCETTPLWAWKSLTRGVNPGMLDCGIADPTNPLPEFDNGSGMVPLEPTRLALGDTRVQADTMDLLAMTPRGDLTSTGYALAHPGHEYLVLDPDQPGLVDDLIPPPPSGTFTVTLISGTYKARWFSLTNRVWVRRPNVVVVGTQAKTFTTPFSSPGPVILHLDAIGA